MVKTGQTWSGLVVTKDSTGALATPSVGPAGVLYVDGTANGATVTITGSNPYKWTVTLPALTAGQCVSMYITATIATIATASVVAEDVADTVALSDVNTALATVDGIVDDLLAVAPDNKPTVAATGETTANVTMWAGIATTTDEVTAMNRLYSMIDSALGVKSFNSAALQNTRSVIGLASANLDTQLAALPTDQDVRDAMKLAPTTGAPGAGSMDAHLDDLLTASAAIQDVTDELDVSAVTQAAASSAGHLTITAGLTFDEGVTGLTIPADWEAAIWTLKYSAEQVDTAAVIQLRAENPAAPLTDGLLRVNGAAPASPITAADGVLTVTQASGRIDVWLSDELTLLLSKATGLGWDVKFVDADGDSSGQRGTADVVLTETRAVA